MTILIHIGNKGSTISINELIQIKELFVHIQKLCHFEFVPKHKFSILLSLHHLAGFTMPPWSSLRFVAFQLVK